MRTKPHEDGRRDPGDGFSPHSFSGHDALRAAYFHRVWIFEPTPDKRTRKIHHLVVVSVPAHWRGNRLGYVSLLALSDHVLLGGFCVAALSEVLQGSAGQRYQFEPRTLGAIRFERIMRV